MDESFSIIRRIVPATETEFFFDSGIGPTTLDPAHTGANITLSGGNLVGTSNVHTANGDMSRSIANHSTGKFYYECTMTTFNVVDNQGQCLLNASAILTNGGSGGDNNSVAYPGDGNIYLNNVVLGTAGSYLQGDVTCCAVDLTNKRIWFRKNAGNWNNSGVADPATNTGGLDISAMTFPLYAGIFLDDDAGSNHNAITVNFGATAYAQTSPAGFSNW